MPGPVIGANPGLSAAAVESRRRKAGAEFLSLTEGWELSTSNRSVSAQVPGTVAQALGESSDHAAYTFRCRFAAEKSEAGEQLILRFGGIATIAEVFLNGESILKSNSMFASHDVDVTNRIRGENDLVIECRALPLREKRSSQPHARWRTRVVAEQQLRWFRTTLLGRAPGFSPGPVPIGPWRPVTLIRRHSGVENLRRSVELDGSTGIVRFEPCPVPGRIYVGDHSAPLESGIVQIPNAKLWRPHTHGDPALYPVRIELPEATIEDTPIGFRAGAEKIFRRGVVWTPPNIVSLQPENLRERLQLLRDAGFNMIRIAGTTFYESEEFHNLCDELGLMVWQDMMFANLDYPFDDPDFRATVRAEAESEIARLSRHVSTTVICGNSEIEQQVGMLGLDPSIARHEFFYKELPELCGAIEYIPSAPSGGDQPFRTNEGVANYFGVGAYMRPLEDARRACVKFASECLAFSNVPEPEMMERIPLASRAWKQAVPRDSGASWDFEDVRDYYLRLLYDTDPGGLRYSDPARYLELSRMTTGEIMAEVFGEWRRAESPNRGGIILWAADLEPGAGWGILDSDGRPKAAYWFLKRALAPRAVWMTDEGLNGIDVHIANDLRVEMQTQLRIALYRNSDPVAETSRSVSIAANSTARYNVEEILGRFVDASYAYKFGPPGHDLIVATIDNPFAQAFRFPAGRPAQRTDPGFTTQTRNNEDGSIEIKVQAKRFAWGVRIAAQGYLADDAYFGIEPGGSRRVRLTPIQDKRGKPALTAINAEGRWAL